MGPLIPPGQAAHRLNPAPAFAQRAAAGVALQARMQRRRVAMERGRAVPLPMAGVPTLNEMELLPAPWTDLTGALDLAQLNQVSTLAPGDRVAAFEQRLIGRGRFENLNRGDLLRPVPVFTSQGVGVQVGPQGMSLSGQVGGGGQHQIVRAREPGDGLPEVLPDTRPGAATAYFTLNFSDIVRRLIAANPAFQQPQGDALNIAGFPTLTRIGDPARSRYRYALNANHPVGGLQPGSQVDVSVLLRVDRQIRIDFLAHRLRGLEDQALGTDGVFGGAGIITNRPGAWPAVEASAYMLGAGGRAAVLGPEHVGPDGHPVAAGSAADLFLAGGLRSLAPFQSTAPGAGTLGRLPASDQGTVSLLDGLGSAGVADHRLRADWNRQQTLQLLADGTRYERSWARFTLSIATIPATNHGWPGLPPAGMERYTIGATGAVPTIKNGVPWFRRHRFKRVQAYHPPPPSSPPSYGGLEWSSWEVAPGEFGLVFGAYSHTTSGARVRFGVESVHARHFVRGVPDRGQAGEFLYIERSGANRR